MKPGLRRFGERLRTVAAVALGLMLGGMPFLHYRFRSHHHYVPPRVARPSPDSARLPPAARHRAAQGGHHASTAH